MSDIEFVIVLSVIRGVVPDVCLHLNIEGTFFILFSFSLDFCLLCCCVFSLDENLCAIIIVLCFAGYMNRKHLHAMKE